MFDFSSREAFNIEDLSYGYRFQSSLADFGILELVIFHNWELLSWKKSEIKSNLEKGVIDIIDSL